MKNFLLILLSLSAHGQVAITPTSLEISPRSRLGEIILTNVGDDERMFETSVKQWTQSNNEDHFANTEEVIILPKAVTIKGKGKQKLRVVAQTNAKDKSQLFYRIFVSEVLGAKAVTSSGLRFLLSISIPVFSHGAGWSEKQQALWSVDFDAKDDGLYLSLANKGNSHIQIHDLTIAGSSGEKLTAMQYVLPGAQYRWPLPKQFVDVKSITAQFKMDNKTMSQVLSIPPRKKIITKKNK